MKLITWTSISITTLCFISNYSLAQNRGGTFNLYNYNVPPPIQNNGIISNQTMTQQALSNQINVTPSLSNVSNVSNVSFSFNNNIALDNTGNIQTNASSYNNSNLNSSINFVANDNNDRGSRGYGNRNVTPTRNNPSNSIVIPIQQQSKIKETAPKPTLALSIQTSNTPTDKEQIYESSKSEDKERASINIELPKITAPKIVASTSPKTTPSTNESINSSSESEVKTTTSSSKGSSASKRIKQHKFKRKIVKPIGRWFKRTFKKKTQKGVFSVKCFSFN